MAEPNTPPTYEHPVAVGESLAAIAAGHGLATADLRALNPRLGAAKDDEPLDRLKTPTLAIPLRPLGTEVLGSLETKKRHEVAIEHRFAVVYGARGSETTGLFDVLEPDGTTARDALSATFHVIHVAPM